MHNGLNIKAARAYVPYQDLENKAMLVGFLDDPDSFANHIKRYTNSLTTQMVFGFRTTSIRDPKLQRLYHVSNQAAATATPVEKELVRSTVFVDMRGGETKNFEKFSEVFLSPVAALLVFPEVVTAAQAEIDRVCGAERLPDLNDLPDLPYVRGCMKESMRWMPTDPLGVPHAVVRDDEYMGYKIPEGAGVMWNVWYEPASTTYRVRLRIADTDVTGPWPTTPAATRTPPASTRRAGRTTRRPRPRRPRTRTRRSGTTSSSARAAACARACTSRTGRCSWPCRGCCGRSTSHGPPTPPRARRRCRTWPT